MKVSLLCCRSVHTIVCLTAAIIMLTLQIKVKKLKLNCHDLLCHVGFLDIDVLKGNIMARASKSQAVQLQRQVFIVNRNKVMKKGRNVLRR